MKLYSVILDIMVLLVLILMTVSAYRKGFLRSAVLVCGYVASVIAAVFFSGQAANFVYDRFLKAPITQEIEHTLENGVNTLELDTIIHEVVEALPDFIANPVLAAYGGEEGLSSLLLGTDQTAGAVKEATEAVTSGIVEPIVISLLQALLCLLIFTICVIIVKMLARTFEGFNQVPVLGPINSALGALLGVLQAGISVYLMALFASVVISLTADQLEWLNTGIIRSTFIFRLFYDLKLF